MWCREYGNSDAVSKQQEQLSHAVRSVGRARQISFSDANLCSRFYSGRASSLSALATKGLAHLLSLALCADVGAESLLRELESALVLSDPEQLDDALLVR